MRLVQVPAVMALSSNFFACTNPATRPDKLTSAMRILDTWEWVESGAVASPGIKTPVTEGYTRTIRFERDQSYYVYINDTLEAKYPYSILRTKIPAFMEDTDEVIRIEDFRSVVYYTFRFSCADSLTLWPLVFDAYGYNKYVRRKLLWYN